MSLETVLLFEEVTPLHPESSSTRNARSVGSEPAHDLMRFRQDFASGAKDMTPLLPAGAIVGAVTGIAATTTGLPPIQAISMSVIVYYPSVMLTSFVLLEAVTPGVILVVTSLVVGSRSMMYSLSLAPHFTRFSKTWRSFLAYFLWTPVYAFSIEQYESNPSISKHGYYLGTAIPLWITVQLSLIAGVLIGRGGPSELQLTFVIPLAFIALLMRFLEDVPTKGAALAAGILVVVASGVPLNLDLIIATVGGTATGLVLRERRGS